jgi:outer membrane lipoprotein-sorting protein
MRNRFVVMRYLKFIGLILLLSSAWSAQALDTNAVINGWLQAQSELKTWQAEFTQTRTLRTLRQPLVSTGQVWFARPNHFRWELGQPAKTIAVRDDKQMLVIYPRLKRAERYTLTGADAGMLGEALALLDAGFPRDRTSFDARFQVKSLTQTNAIWSVALEPANPSTRRMIPMIQLTLATNDFSLLANEITLPDGSRMKNEFTNAVLNASFDADRFTPKLGADYQITEPMKP